MIQSLHHVTATVTEAAEDLAFYTGLLGLRLVKRTVNFDNTGVYHLYYGDERGSPSTLMTTFPYGGQGVPVGSHGAGQISVTSFSVPAGSLDFWEDRLTSSDVPYESPEPGFGESSIIFSDPSGLRIELVEADDDPRPPWVGGGISSNAAIRGLHGVTFPAFRPEKSIEFLTEVLGLSVAGRSSSRTRVELGEGGPGGFIDVVHDPSSPRGVNGLGTVHHVAMAIPGPDDQLQVRKELVRLGYSVTEVRDRQYFLSIYFREPAGVLYEIATTGPGFETDEELAELGRDLKLPPWEEPHRASIEANLPPLE